MREQYSTHTNKQPNILPPLFNREETEVQQFMKTYGQDIKQAVSKVRNIRLI